MVFCDLVNIHMLGLFADVLFEVDSYLTWRQGS